MNNWYQTQSINMAMVLAEDVAAPELRNPLCGGLRGQGWLRRLLKKQLR